MICFIWSFSCSSFLDYMIWIWKFRNPDDNIRACQHTIFQSNMAWFCLRVNFCLYRSDLFIGLGLYRCGYLTKRFPNGGKLQNLKTPSNPETDVQPNPIWQDIPHQRDRGVQTAAIQAGYSACPNGAALRGWEWPGPGTRCSRAESKPILHSSVASSKNLTKVGPADTSKVLLFV